MSPERPERAEQPYRALFHDIDAGFCIIEVLFDESERPVDYRFLETNTAFEKHTGLIGAVGKTIRELAPGKGQHWFDAYADVARSGVPHRFENHAVELDRWFDVWALPFGDPANRQVALLFADVTARKKEQDALFRRERTLAQAGKMAQLGAWDLELTDPGELATSVLTWSDEVYRMFGIDPMVPVTNELFFAHVHPEDREHINRSLRDAIATGAAYSIEHRIRRADGAERVVREHAELLHDDQQRLVRIIGAVQDITELKRSEETLREVDRRKDEFLAMLSHELRNPLAPIRSGLYLVDRTPPGSDRARRALATIGRQVEHMTKLVDDLLDVSRISRGKIQLHREWLEIADVVARSVEDQRPIAEERGIAVTLERSGDAWVDGDATRLTQAVGNVLQNAIKFTPPKGRIAIEVEYSGNHAVIRVRDTGVGVTADMLPRLFEPFIQADHSLDRRAGGLGLGLSLVKGLVELHGGDVRADSEGAGRGTTITIRLPARNGSPKAAAPRVAAETTRPRRVLIVEDNVDAAQSLKDFLELDGHDVSVAFNGPEGLAKARAISPDIVLCDIGLPGMDGYEVARAFRSDEDLKDVKLVALTGYVAPEDKRRATHAGFDHHLAKPADAGVLHRVLSEGEGSPAGLE